jgi:hypothetical protein
MPRISSTPFEKIDPELQADVFKDFIKFSFRLVSTTRGSVNMKLTELACLKVAEKNECSL